MNAARGKQIRQIVARVLAQEHIPAAAAETLAPACQTLVDRIVARIAERPATATPLVVGLCGAQGSGKTTLALLLAHVLDQAGLPTVQFSLDDLYLPAEARRRLGATIHPLLRTRGVPGTHDVPLGLALLGALRQATADGATPVPRVDKASDDRLPEAQWPHFRGRPAVVLFEGWCVGAQPQPAAALAVPLNRLEREEDPDGTWRRTVNDSLASPYQALFGQLDLLVLLQAPGFEQVFAWRKEQEDKLRNRLHAAGRDTAQPGVMDDAQLERFIGHYERLTRHILDEMPGRADIVMLLGAGRSIREIR